MITIDTKRSASGLGEYGYGNVIRSDGLVNISGDANFGWATTGARLGGQSWEEIGGFDVASGANDLGYNGIMGPSRVENRGLAGKSLVCVAVESEVEVYLKVTLGFWYESGLSGTVEKDMYGPAARGWTRLWFVVSDIDYQAIRVTVEPWGGAGRKVWAVQVMEAAYQNLESVLEPVALGDAWIGAHYDGGLVDTWSRGTNEPSSDAIGFESSRSTRPAMMRDVPAAGLSAVDFTGNKSMTSTAPVAIPASDDFMVAIAINASRSDSGNAWLQGGRFSIQTLGSNISVIHFNAVSASKTLTVSAPDAGDGTTGWFDVVVLCRDDVMTLYLNGVDVGDVAIPGGNNDTLGDIVIGRASNKLAMPVMFTGDISHETARDYIDYRRHVHGIF